jgi:FKBP-type peptidyl-prolyl cis-trans isomerase
LAQKANQNPGQRRGAAAQSSGRSNSNTVLIIAICIALAIVGYAVLKFFSPANSGIATTTGLRYVDEVVGNGASPSPGRIVTVHYTGWLENGTKFDSSVDRGQPLEFPIGTGRVIKGWDEGVMSMKVGGKRKLIIPPSLGYGARNLGRIPPNSTLIFEVELLGVR